jgi:hypothetical protein
MVFAPAEMKGILALQPGTFRYKGEVYPDEIPQFGLVAEEVERLLVTS